MSEEKKSEENTLKILERSTEKKSFLKRVTHVKVDLNGNITEYDIEHFAKPIEKIGAILDYIMLYQIEIKVGSIVVEGRKRPFQSSGKFFWICIRKGV